MTRQVYLPLFKVGVSYMVRQGRAWTALEHAILHKLSQGPETAAELIALSDMPDRLVFQALLELMGEGWVVLNTAGKSVSFEATPAGVKAAAMTTLPVHTSTTKRFDTVCIDRLVGGTLDPDHLVLVHKEKIPLDAFVLNPHMFKPQLSPSETLDRLYLLENETFEDWIDHRMQTQNLYAALKISGDRIEGLPPYASVALQMAIYKEVLERAPDVGDEANPLDEPAFVPTTFDCAVTEEDLCVGGDEHRAVLERVLAEAKSTVVIHSCFVSVKTIRWLLPHLTAAAERKVTVDLLWGLRFADAADWARTAVKEAREVLSRIPPKLSPYIRFAEQETGSHAKVIVADSGPKHRFEAYVGSCNWLSTQFDAIDVSLRVENPRLLSRLVGVLATLRIPTSGEWGPDVHRLVRLKVHLDGLQAIEGPARVSFVIDREHLALVRLARDSAQRRVVSSCDLLGPAGETSVFVPMRSPAESGVAVELIYNRPTRTMKDSELQAAEAALATRGITLRRLGANLHAKFLLWDDADICVTSFNWLSTTHDAWKPTAAEIGLFATGADLNAALIARFASAASEHDEAARAAS